MSRIFQIWEGRNKKNLRHRRSGPCRLVQITNLKKTFFEFEKILRAFFKFGRDETQKCHVTTSQPGEKRSLVWYKTSGREKLCLNLKNFCAPFSNLGGTKQKKSHVTMSQPGERRSLVWYKTSGRENLFLNLKKFCAHFSNLGGTKQKSATSSARPHPNHATTFMPLTTDPEALARAAACMILGAVIFAVLTYVQHQHRRRTRQRLSQWGGPPRNLWPRQQRFAARGAGVPRLPSTVTRSTPPHASPTRPTSNGASISG